VRIWCNDNDPNACAWLNELEKEGQLPPLTVDSRPIEAVKPNDLACDECHFFAGIGSWPYALRLAGWSGPVWTGSCPCQPFSTAGKRLAERDPRHLWPVWFSLIAKCRPPTIFGEQVASGLGHQWLARVRADLEAAGYAVGAANLCAASTGAPHIRQRLYWGASRLANTERQRGRCGSTRCEDAIDAGVTGKAGDFWSGYTRISCRDGKTRRIEPGTFPLAHGVPGRVGLLRGYGNAIVPQVAAAFVKAFRESLNP